MALNASVLSALMREKIEQQTRRLSDDADPLDVSDAVYDAIAAAVVEHIKTSADVINVVVTGVTSGPSSSGPNVIPGKVV